MKKTLCLLALTLIAHNSFCKDRNVSELFKDIKVQRIEGDAFTDIDLSEQMDGKIVIIEFWEYWCGPCLQSMPHLKALIDKYPNDLKVLAVSSDDLGKTKTAINKRIYPFTYIYDKYKKLTAVFPHTGIPHSVIIDKSGNVIRETYPFEITQDAISLMLEGKDPQIAFDKDSDQNSTAEPMDSNTLVSFILSRSLPDDEHGALKSDSGPRDFRILTGDNEYIDTVGRIIEYTLSMHNILDFYREAYNFSSESYFEYPEELQYITSRDLNHLYNLSHSSSSLLGNAGQILIGQLNSAFGLTCRRITKNVEVLVLTDLIPNDSTLIIETDADYSGMRSYYGYGNFEFVSDAASTYMLAKAIEQKMKIPVVMDMDGSTIFNIDIRMELDSGETERWIDLFRQNGIILEKQKREIEMIEIRKL